MRLSEKSIELNYCSEATRRWGGAIPPFWCGLTQAQEAKEGIDVAGHLNGRLVVYQFKASNRIVRGQRQFRAPHDQFEKLRRLGGLIGNVFYVFPDIGTVGEYISAGTLLSKTWLCDVSQPALASLAVPSRASGYHLVNLDVSGSKRSAWWHSDPAETRVIRADEHFASREGSALEGLAVNKNNCAELLRAILAVPGRKMMGMIVK